VTAEITNPAAAGLIAGLVLWLAQMIWNKVMGGSNEQTLPSQLTQINAQLTDINAKLGLAINDYHHLKEQFEELKQDFWDHIKNHHN
jgi:hypothetical protein